eukprot:742577-Prymnesium_polylepis.1
MEVELRLHLRERALVHVVAQHQTQRVLAPAHRARHLERQRRRVALTRPARHLAAQRHARTARLLRDDATCLDGPAVGAHVRAARERPKRRHSQRRLPGAVAATAAGRIRTVAADAVDQDVVVLGEPQLVVRPTANRAGLVSALQQQEPAPAQA